MSTYEENLFQFNAGNIPSSNFLSNFISDSFLKDDRDLYFVYTKNGKIKQLEDLKISREHIPSIYLYEPLTFKINGNYNFTFYSEFSLDDIDSITCDELDSIEIFRNNNSLSKIVVYSKTNTYGYLKNHYPYLEIKCLDIYLRHLSYELFKKEYDHANFTKTFWCGNRRYTHHRLLMMLRLQNYPGRYSWPFSCSIDVLDEITWIDSKLSNRLKSEIISLNKKEFFIDHLDKKLDVDSSDFFKIPNTPNHISKNIEKSYLDCFCAIVNESVFAQPFPDLGEKILNPIFFGMPFVLVSAPRSLEYLKQLGFKTFDNWWDESYDLIENHQERLLKIYDLIDYIGTLSHDEHIKIKKSMFDVIAHNKNVLKDLKNNDLVL